MNLRIATPGNFSFWNTVCSHGWCALPPFSVDKEHQRLVYALQLNSGNIVSVNVHAENKKTLIIKATNSTALRRKDVEAVTSSVKSCLRLEEDFSEFYRQAKRSKAFRWIPAIGAGRLLRAPTVFEDVVKMMCTTNCSWALTEIMTENLCRTFGKQIDDTTFTFPQPEALADSTERVLRKNIRAGYRAPYLLELARRVVNGDLYLETWRNDNLPTEDLFHSIRSVKGIGPYAAGNILKLLGRYDYLAIDSWCRKRFFELYTKGRRTSDKRIEKFYEPLGMWRGLFFWLDLTKHWYQKEFPL